MVDQWTPIFVASHSQSVFIVISFFEIVKILKLSKAYIIANTYASILLIFFSLYFPLVYLQIFYVFFS